MTLEPTPPSSGSSSVSPSESSSPSGITLLRGQIMHTPRNPFEHDGALVTWSDGGLAFDETILAVGNFTDIQRDYPDATVVDARDSLILPGFVDVHVHYPQVHMIGAMGMTLLTWLKTRTLPEEANMANDAYARLAAHNTIQSLLANGTTTALVFGAHFASAQAILFEEALKTGMHIVSGLVVSDQNLRPELEVSPEQAYEQSKTLIQTYHGEGLHYALQPRFSVSCSEAMLEVVGSLMQEFPDVYMQTHINENVDEIAFVRELFPASKDYLDTYDVHGLLGPRSSFAHNIHVSDRELARYAETGSSVAHCPSSNMFIGSGIFDMKRHLAAEIPFALGSDVGGGTGYSLFKEALMSYQGQMLHDNGYLLGPSHLLYLATQAGADVLSIEGIGAFTAGNRADLMVVRPPAGSSLANVLTHSPSAEASLSAVFTLAREESVRQTYLAGKLVHEKPI